MTLNDILSRPDEQYVTEVELSEALGRSISALRTLACRRAGPPRTKIGKQVLYRVGALRKYLRDHETDFDALRARVARRRPRRRGVG